MVLLLCFMLTASDQVVRIATENPYTLQQRFVVVMEEEVWIFNPTDQFINVFSMNGEKLRSLGGRGQGPDQFNRIRGISASDGKIYIEDRSVIHVLDKQGNKLSQFPKERGLRGLVKTTNGWAWGTWSLPFQGDYDGQLMMGDHQIKNPVQLIDMSNGRNREIKARDPRVMFKNPAQDLIHLLGEPDGQTLYLRHRDPQLKISIINSTTGEVKGRIERDRKLIPFDNDWGQDWFDNKVKKSRRLKMVPAFPEFFPSMRTMHAPGDRKLYVAFWQKPFDEPTAFTCFDQNGQEVTDERLPDDAVMRTMYVDGNMIILACPESEEAETNDVVILPIGHLETYLKSENEI